MDAESTLNSASTMSAFVSVILHMMSSACHNDVKCVNLQIISLILQRYDKILYQI